MRMRPAVRCAVLLLHILFCAGAAAQGSMPREVPLFTLEDLSGKPVRLEDYREWSS